MNLNLPAPIKAYWDRLDEWLASLAPRERLIVIAGAIVVTVWLLFLALWQPLANAHHSRALALDEARDMAARLESAAAALRGASGSGGGNRNISLLAAVNQTKGALGKEPSRVQPEGDKSVNVWIEDVSFDALVKWLGDLETRFGVTAISADIERQSGAGMVNARLALGRP